MVDRLISVGRARVILNRNISNTKPGRKRINRWPDSRNNCWPLASYRVFGGQAGHSSAWRFAPARSWLDHAVLAITLQIVFLVSTLADASPVEYVSDRPDLILSSSQDWGALGFDVAAHQPGQAGQPLQIGEQQFSRGLGHHANGAIVIWLDGGYSGFDASVGLQPCSGGSVVFRVLVDGQLRFDSGVLKAADAPKTAQVSLAGAQELRLEAKDAGDGINCDMANWAEARLTRASGTARTPPPEPRVDIARFALVATWDPQRMDGCRANRVQEFQAEDVFLETDLTPNQDGTFAVPMATNGLACIGLQWLNRRALKELSLAFVDPAQVPATNSVQVQGWFGESAWQGSWKPLAGEWQADGTRLVFRLKAGPAGSGLVQTQKIRWVFPVRGRPVLRGLSAFTRSRWETVKLFIQAEKSTARSMGEVSVFNGELVSVGDVEEPIPQLSSSRRQE
ncbi:MAG: NPCBM/NEW2 domain-containing protein, partial [Chloroflexi bacterium]|nr:NPCBM/NEW2 domain-containing protein [Chloroflexota bacterium]